MSNAVTALNGAEYQGYVTVREAPMTGMVTLRGDLSDKALAKDVSAYIDGKLPDTRQIVQGAKGACAWMAHDELLILCDHAEAVDLAAKLNTAGRLAVAVSDARAVFDLIGDKADEVLAKAAPVDTAKLEMGEMRRTRLAQVAVAVWRTDTGLRLVCFRSVAGYVFDVLTTLARPGSEV